MTQDATPPPPSHYEAPFDVNKLHAYVHDDRPDIGAIKHTAFHYMDVIFSGWCSYEKASVMIDLILNAKPQVVVEIGVWAGKSLIPMAHAIKESGGSGVVYGIDPWNVDNSLQGIIHTKNQQFWTLADYEGTLAKLQNNIQIFGLSDHVSLIRNTSLDTPPIYDIDILHIDGNHSDETSYIDATKWVPLVKRGGWIIFDDINWPDSGLPTNQRAVEYLNQHCHKIGEFCDLSVWGVWYKP